MPNLWSNLPQALPEELVTVLHSAENLRIERIVSTGQSSPPGFWYDQAEAEWIVVLSGAARLRLEEEPAARQLQPGDYLLLPPGCRHRVEWTSPDEPTVWLAVFYGVGGPGN